MNKATSLTCKIIVKATIAIVWEFWTIPKHIQQWNNMSDKWHTPRAENDLRVGGKLFLRMETKNGSEGFDYSCTYTEVEINKRISYTIADGRNTFLLFSETNDGTEIIEVFDPANTPSVEIQQSFCQSILNNFKTYVEDQLQERF